MLREASRLQAFPNDFIIPVSDTQAYKQFENSVAVVFIREIDQEVLTSLEIGSKNKNRKHKNYG